MDNNGIKFGSLLRAIRESRMMSQKELAEKANINPTHLNKIEKGARMPSDEVLFRLADTLVAEELFTAAGRLVPPEFEKKYPLKEPLKFPIEEAPRLLENLYTRCETNFRKEANNYRRVEDEKRALEEIISSMLNVHRWSITDLKQLIEKECKSILPDFNDYTSTIFNLLNCYDQLNRKQDELELIAMEKWLAAGKKFGITETWKEIKQIISIDSAGFLQECFQIEEEDAVFIIDFIQLRRKRKIQNPPKND